MSAKERVNVSASVSMTPLLVERLHACSAAQGLIWRAFVIFALEREVSRIEARLAGHGDYDTSAKERVGVYLNMMPRLAERMDACSAARGLSRHDFFIFALEREASQIEARLKRRAQERLAQARDAGRHRALPGYGGYDTSAKVRVKLNLNMTPLLVERMDACSAAQGLDRHNFVIFALKRELTQIEARLAGHGDYDTSAKGKMNVNLNMTPLLVERMDACSAARGLDRHDFIAFALEREASQIEARLKRRARERLARREARANQ